MLITKQNAYQHFVEFKRAHLITPKFDILVPQPRAFYRRVQACTIAEELLRGKTFTFPPWFWEKLLTTYCMADQGAAVDTGLLLTEGGLLNLALISAGCDDCCATGTCPSDCTACGDHTGSITDPASDCCCDEMGNFTAETLTRSGCTWAATAFVGACNAAVRVELACLTVPDPDEWECTCLLSSPPFCGECGSCNFGTTDKWVGTITADACAAGTYSCDFIEGSNCSGVDPLECIIT